MTSPDKLDLAFSTALIRLLRGPVYAEQAAIWNTVLGQRAAIEDYFQKIGLSLLVDEVEGYAFLRSATSAAEEGVDQAEPKDEASGVERSATLPRLMRRRALTYDMTLLLVHLREALEQYDVATPDDHRLVLSRQALGEMLLPYFPERTDETKQQNRIDALINKAVEMDILHELKGAAGMYEVRRIVKAIVDASFLATVKQQLIDHSQTKGAGDRN